MSLRLGVFGGTFDPIHLGHLLLAEIARHLLKLDRVLFVPARVPPHKGEVETPPEHRYRMTRLACADNPHFGVSDLELRREGPSYTVETLQSIRRESPEGTEHYLLIGADSARDLESWKNHEVLLTESNVVVLGRPGVDREDLPKPVGARATLLSTPLVEISSSEIRRLIRAGESIRYQVTDAVERYIRAQRLYVS